MFPAFETRVDQVDHKVGRDQDEESAAMIEKMIAPARDRLTFLLVRKEEGGGEIKIDWRHQEPKNEEERPMLCRAPPVLDPPADDDSHERVHHPQGMDPVARCSLPGLHELAHAADKARHGQAGHDRGQDADITEGIHRDLVIPTAPSLSKAFHSRHGPIEEMRFAALFMKILPLIAFATVASTVFAAPPTASIIVNATAIDPGSGKVIPNAAIRIEGDHIAAIIENTADFHRDGEKVIDAKGKFVLPGYIDTHVHFFQSGGLFTRPDAVDLNNVRPYKDEVALIKKNLPDTFKRYLRCGITSVLDIGGPIWNFEMRKIANQTAAAPRVAAAGPLISSVSRPQLDLGDPPIVKIDTPEQGREFVRKLAPQKPDYIKIWWIVPPAL